MNKKWKSTTKLHNERANNETLLIQKGSFTLKWHIKMWHIKLMQH